MLVRIYSPSTGASVVMAEHKFTTSVVVRHGQKDHHNDDHRRSSPVNTDFVDQVEVLGAKYVDEHTD